MKKDHWITLNSMAVGMQIGVQSIYRTMGQMECGNNDHIKKLHDGLRDIKMKIEDAQREYDLSLPDEPVDLELERVADEIKENGESTVCGVTITSTQWVDLAMDEHQLEEHLVAGRQNDVSYAMDEALRLLVQGAIDANV